MREFVDYHDESKKSPPAIEDTSHFFLHHQISSAGLKRKINVESIDKGVGITEKKKKKLNKLKPRLKRNEFIIIKVIKSNKKWINEPSPVVISASYGEHGSVGGMKYNII